MDIYIYIYSGIYIYIISIQSIEAYVPLQLHLISYSTTDTPDSENNNISLKYFNLEIWCVFVAYLVIIC